MRAGGGHAKGAGFERTVCKQLSRFMDPKGRDTLFWRSAMSGGRATVQKRSGVKNTTQLGDITCVHKKGRWLTDNFIIECKHVRNLNIQPQNLIFGTGKFHKFWQKLLDECDSHEKAPLLIAKQNGSPIFVFTTADGLGRYCVRGHAQPDIVISSPFRADIYLLQFERMFGNEA